jgi:hypothetical protein
VNIPGQKSILLVTYDLKTAGKNYAQFYEELKKQGVWWHFIASTWLIATTKTPKEILEAVQPQLTNKDCILILPMTRPYWGTLPKAAWEWLKTQGLQP